MNTGDRRTPPDSIPALAVRVEGAEHKAERSADYSFKAYQTSQECLGELRGIRREQERTRLQYRDAPLFASAFAIVLSSLTALYVAAFVVH